MPNESARLDDEALNFEERTFNKSENVSPTSPLIPRNNFGESIARRTPPAKPKRKFEYFNLIYNDRINTTSYRYIDDDGIFDDRIVRNNVSDLSAQNSEDRNGQSDSDCVDNNNNRKALLGNLSIVPFLKRKNCKEMNRNNDVDLNEFDISPVPQQRYRYRSPDESGRPSQDASLAFSNGFSSRMMSPVHEEDENDHNDHRNDTDNYDDCETYGTDETDLYNRVRQIDHHHRNHNVDFNANAIDFGQFDDDIPPLSFANFNKKYSMGGVNGRIQDVAPSLPQAQQQNQQAGRNQQQLQDSSSTSKSLHDRYSCCGWKWNVKAAVLTIAIIELLFIVYQAVSTTLAFIKTADDNTLAFVLTVFSFVLAVIAVVLLLIGVYRRSPYFLVPHLLMQFAMFSSAFALCIYFLLLLIGGTSITLDVIFYEDSALGEIGLAKASAITPQKLTAVVNGLNTILILLLICTLVFFILQVWFFTVVRKCYKNFFHLIEQKAPLNMMSAVTVPAKSSSNNSTATPSSMTTVTDALPHHRHLQQQQLYNNTNNSNGVLRPY